MSDLKKKFEDFLHNNNISMNKAAAGIGYTPSVISQYLKGDYSGSIDKVEEKISAWLELQISRQITPDVPLIGLPRTVRIKNTVRIAHEEKFISLILGSSGTGKSRALEEYYNENKYTSILIKCDPTFVLSTVVMQLAHKLGVDSKGRIADVSDRIVGELNKRDVVVLVDEADYLTDNIFEYLRIAVNDKGHSGLVFVGLQRIEHRIKNLRNDHRQLENRVGIMFTVEEVTEKDVKEVLHAVWSEKKLDPETVKAFWKSCRKSLHLLIRMIVLTRRTLRIRKVELPTADLVEDAATYLMA